MSNTITTKVDVSTAAALRSNRKRGRSRRSYEQKLAELKRRLLEISDLGAANAVLGWDQATYMPRHGAPARARQGATPSRLAHERSLAPALRRLLDALEHHAAALPYDRDDAILARGPRR